MINMQPFWDAQLVWITALQSGAGWLAIPMQFLSALGRSPFYILSMCAIYWCLDRRLGLRLVLMLVASAALNDALKNLFHQPRPYWLSAGIVAYGHENSFGLPSGHAQNAVALWGLLAAKMSKRWARALAWIIAIAISVSRVYVGVHWPSDVLVGALVGGMLLWAFLGLDGPVTEWFSGKRRGNALSAAIGVSIALLALASLARLTLWDWVLPESWVANAAMRFPEPLFPSDPEYALLTAGLLLGLGIGLAILGPRGSFRVDGEPRQRVLRYLVGIAGVGLLYVGLGLVTPNGVSLASVAVQGLRATLIGLWVSLFAPLLFLRLTLAEREAQPRVYL